MADSKSDMPVKPENDRHRPTLRTNIIISIVVALATIALFELGLRISGYNPRANQPPKSIVELRMHTPNQTKVVDVAQINADHPISQVRIDARSYIKPSYQYDNPDITVAFLGASTTECSAVQELSRFPAMVSRLFGENGFKVNTLNAGHAGNTMQDSINIFFNHVVFDRPQIVVIMQAANDVGILAQHGGDYKLRAERPLSFGDVIDWFKSTASQNVYLAGVARQFTSVVISNTRQSVPGDLRDRRQRTDPDFAKALPIELYRQRLRVFVHMARDFGAIPVLMTQPFSGSQNEFTPNWAELGSQDLFNEIIRKVGAEEQVLVIDLVKHLTEDIPEWDEPMKVFYDGLHVTDYGSEVYAHYIASELLPVIEAAVAHPQADEQN